VFGRHRPSFAGRYNRLGVDYARHSEVGKARGALLTAIRIWPWHLAAYWHLCRTYVFPVQRSWQYAEGAGGTLRVR
jgi:hypothetical protein